MLNYIFPLFPASNYGISGGNRVILAPLCAWPAGPVLKVFCFVPKPDAGLEQRVEAIRRFNRMYMHKIGILEENVFGSSLTPAEVRVLNEITATGETTATTLARDLKMDNGYLSRIIGSFEKQGLIEKSKSKEDARQYRIALTQKGCDAGDVVNEGARKIMMSIVAPLPVEDQIRLVAAMTTIDRIVNKPGQFEPAPMRPPFTMRPHRLGDMGRVIHSCAVQFAADYGWNEEFEAELAELAASFIRSYNAETDRCWIAEIDGHLVGSVFLRKKDEQTGEAVLPYVAPEARGMGIGSHLFSSLIGFARKAGYRRLVMRTESVIDFAGSMLQQAGLKLVRETPHTRYGRESVGQDWELSFD